MGYLIYLLFGKNSADHQSELIYSLLSFKKVAGEWSNKNVTILIYTDNAFSLPECLSDIRVEFNILDKEEISNRIKRANGHALILKAVVMNDFLKKYQACGILTDTDTFFIKDPGQLFDKVNEGCLLMHLKEYPLANRPDICSFFKKKGFKQLDGSDHLISPDFFMWNSGIVGLTQTHLHLTNEVIYLIEQIAEEKEWPAEQARFIEQTCYSYYLQKQGPKLLPAEDVVVHYWFFKQARYLIGNHFGFFYGSDEDRFNQLINNQPSQAEQLRNLPYSALPSLIARLMKQFGLFEEYHFECLPMNTYIGKVIRGMNSEVMMKKV